MSADTEILYHRRTLALLGPQVALPSPAVDGLLRLAEANGVVLPPSYLEWARIDDGSILQTHSGCDWFYLHDPKLVVLPDGTHGLLFHSENQNNYDMVVALDGSDDPPVLYAWRGRPPWIRFTERFSDCVFAQVFDWQHMRVILDDDAPSDELSMARMELSGDGCLGLLRARFEETVSTRSAVEADRFTEYRFVTPAGERINVVTGTVGGVVLQITGAAGSVPALEADLLEAFAADVRPRDFSSVHEAAAFLGYALENGLRARARFAFLERPAEDVLDRLAACHADRSLRVRSYDRPVDERRPEVELGGEEWGVAVRLRRGPGGYRWILGSAG